MADDSLANARTMKLEAEKPRRHPAWLITIRNFMFPRFNEVSYVTLVWCTAYLLLLYPYILRDLADRDARFWIFPIAAVYVAFRMLGNKKLDHGTKIWASATYYGFISCLTFMSINSQIESGHYQMGTFESINFAVAIVVLCIAGVRFIVTLFIFRTGDETLEKLLTERFSDKQHSWIHFVVIASISLIVMSTLRSYYPAELEALLLVSFAYTIALHKLIFGAIPNTYAALFGKHRARIKLSSR